MMSKLRITLIAIVAIILFDQIAANPPETEDLAALEKWKTECDASGDFTPKEDTVTRLKNLQRWLRKQKKPIEEKSAKLLDWLNENKKSIKKVLGATAKATGKAAAKAVPKIDWDFSCCSCEGGCVLDDILD
ncbi:uncharacterized protein LOC129565393 [Sitodiplosis mosellana]|uniref:uncharacterized protein LOC129565393 n=1 Tax=Sitodiplosis mosellana TaxID=263140 RepID=UPI002444BD92|nr:uncharacterized protein LOC129565393 [Sitodiplosis mosellana]